MHRRALSSRLSSEDTRRSSSLGRLADPARPFTRSARVAAHTVARFRGASGSARARGSVRCSLNRAAAPGVREERRSGRALRFKPQDWTHKHLRS
ncbi:hypothetical protein MRX96_019595 [Rhipicephalus microplus]